MGWEGRAGRAGEGSKYRKGWLILMVFEKVVLKLATAEAS